MKWDITVGGKPIPKGRPKVARGHAYTPERTKERERIIAETWIDKYGRTEPTNRPLRMWITYSFEIPHTWSKKKKAEAVHYTKRPDLDNLDKCVCDALNGLAYVDDAQVVQMISRKFYGAFDSTKIEIEEI